MIKNKEFDKEGFLRRTNHAVERLFKSSRVLNVESEKARINNAVEFYIDKMGTVSSPTQVSSIVYSEYAIKHFKGSVAKGYSALWNSVYSAFRGGVAFPIAVVVGTVVSVFVLVCIALLALLVIVLAMLAGGGLLYLFAGVIGLPANTASAMAFAGVGLMALGAFLFFVNPAKKLFKASNRFVSIPIFALSICVRQYARSKRVHLTNASG